VDDLPTVPPGPVDKFLVMQMAAVAESEAGLISQRTRSTRHGDGAGSRAR
jgi:DNA invertase Pin-like site-specific DNA recombinase